MPTIQFRRDTASNWTSNDPTLLMGELGIETDTYKIKMGDGTTAWSSLGYLDINDPPYVGPIGGSNSGFIAGGQTPSAPSGVNVIQTWPFSSDTNTSDHGDLHEAVVGSATVSDVNNSNLYTCTAGTAVSKYSSTSNTTASSGDVTLTASHPDGCAVMDRSKGYIMGAPSSDVIDRFPFAAEGTASDVGNLVSTSAGRLGTTMSPDTAYAAGAYPGGSNVIQKFTFASEGNAADSGDLVASIYGHVGSFGPTHGFFAGSYPTTNVIQSFPFASGGNTTDVADMNLAAGMSAGSTSYSHGYIGGGYPTDQLQKYPTAAGTAGAGSKVGDLLSTTWRTSGGFS